MKTNAKILRGGDNDYSCPTVARLDVKVERGFASSNEYNTIPGLGYGEYDGDDF